MASRPPNVLYEDNHLLVVNKPSGLATMGTQSSQTSLLANCKEYLKQKYKKPGNVFLGVVSRLDQRVSGVIVFARTSKAAKRLSAEFRERRVEKIYWAIVSGRVQPRSFIWTDWLLKDEPAHRMRVVTSEMPGARRAVLSGRVLGTENDRSLLELELQTGRKHQIRVQCAHRKHPILGDRKYGSRKVFPDGIGLLAKSLTFDHPVRHEPMSFEVPVPRSWRPFTGSD